MIVSYVDLLGDHQRHRIEADVTTDHAAASYGIPVIVLPDGDSLSIQSWILLNYQVEEITPGELDALKCALAPYTQPAVNPAVSMGRKGGSAKSPRKAAASAANGRLGGRPGGIELDVETAAMVSDQTLMAALAAQDERLAAVVTAVHVEGATLAEVATRLGLSRERIRQLWAQGLRRLRGLAKPT